MRLFEPGCYEPLKAGFHGTMLGLAVLFTGYNAVAFWLRGNRHLARNVAIYSTLVLIEWKQVQTHRGVMADSRPSEWGKATQPDDLRCPGCGETRMLERIAQGWLCAVCSWTWRDERDATSADGHLGAVER